MNRFASMSVLSFGAVVINTVPVWIGALGDYPALGDGLAGAFASLVLLSASITCAGVGALKPSLAARYMVAPALALLTFGQMLPAVVLAAICVGLGAALGALTRAALRAIALSDNGLQTISFAISLGLAASLVFYLLLPALGVSPLLLLLILSLPLLLLRFASIEADAPDYHRSYPVGPPIRFIGFFVMMGAYWTFLDLFGVRFNDENAVNLWLLASLVSGACGSFLAAKLKNSWHANAQALALVVAAATGAASYVAPDLLIFGMTILANGFALFLFFPLYLLRAGEQMPQAMAGYLVGFSAGGLAGALLVEIGGYQTLAAAILTSGLLSVIRRPNRSLRQ